MTSSFDEHTSVPRNQNADLLIQPGDFDFRRNSPSIEDFDETPPTAKTQSKTLSKILKGSASKLVDEKRLQPRKEGWKLFSPSTWKGLRGTAWGRKKARQRHINRVAKDLKKFMFAPRGEGSPYRWADLWADDPQLATNKAYGMGTEDEQAWREYVNPRFEDLLKKPALRLGEAVLKKPLRNPQGQELMSRKSFKEMLTQQNRNSGRGQEDDDREPGELLGDHPRMHLIPGHDEQDREGDGIPSVWKEMAANPGKWEPKNPLPRQLPSDAKGQGGGPHISETDSIEEEIKDDGAMDMVPGRQEMKYMLGAMNANNNIVEDVESQSSDDEW